MGSEAAEWDSAYRGEAGFDGPPPWNIGEPQPALAALVKMIRSDVLDAGCGYADLSLMLAEQGHTVVGIDVAPTAVAAARRAARERGLHNATFVEDDVTTFTGYDGRFNTVIDSTLFHSLPVEARDAYLRAVHRAAAPGAAFHMLTFATGAFPPDFPYKPHELTEDELRESVSKYWVIHYIRPAVIHAYIPQIPDASFEFPSHETDENGRQKMPAFLLSAHKAE
jgi:cyclopropane fatty-acyl-phospholipid synthase-like methyltransferase